MRNEDARLLTGRALFLGDVQLPGTLHAAFLRSPHAHARPRSVDVARARALHGVVAAYTKLDFGDYWKPGLPLVSRPPVAGAIFHERTLVQLAKGRVRPVGEPVAVVAAEGRRPLASGPAAFTS